MARLNQINENDYPSQEKIHEDFDRLYRYLQVAERNGLTLKEQFDKILAADGAVKGDFFDLRWDSDEIQYRIGGGTWQSLGVGVAALQGPAGPSGAGTGDMVRATYDPDSDGKIAYAQMALTDGEVPPAKVNGLEAALLARAFVTVSATAPVSPTYPPTGPLHIWIDTAGTSPIWKWWDGIGSWLPLDGSASSGGGTATAGGTVSLEAGESISNRDIVFVPAQPRHGTSTLAAGGTAFASAGTAANAFDGSTGTSCDTTSTTGHVGYQKSGMSVGLVKIQFAAGIRTHALVFETSTDGSTYDPRLTVPSATYDGAHPAFFVIPNPTEATYFRVRQTGGTSPLVVRTMELFARSFAAGKVYRWDDDAGTPNRRGDRPGVALGAVAAGADVEVQFGAGTITGFSGLVANTGFYTDLDPGGVTQSPIRNALFLGVASAVDTLEFNPTPEQHAVGDIVMRTGAFAVLPDDLIPCDGRYLSRSLHPRLFALIGTQYGGGDTETSFQVPDLRDRFIVAARQDDSEIPKTNLTGSLTVSGGARTASATAGGGGANVAETGVPDGALQVTVDPPYYSLILAIKAG